MLRFFHSYPIRPTLASMDPRYVASIAHTGNGKVSASFFASKKLKLHRVLVGFYVENIPIASVKKEKNHQQKILGIEQCNSSSWKALCLHIALKLRRCTLPNFSSSHRSFADFNSWKLPSCQVKGVLPWKKIDVERRMRRMGCVV